MFEELHKALDEYKKWRHPGLDPLEEGEPYALVPERALADVKLRWTKDEWPNSRRTGVYVVLSDDEQVLYVGRAGLLGERLADHFRKGTNGECCSPGGYEWGKPPVYVITVAVPKDRKFEVGCLEEFLIERFPGSDNIRGKICSI
ncbi:MAG TPA: GIY-YIG nuclease family protein [Candidatus Sulfotelmatobacter sp.]